MTPIHRGAGAQKVPMETAKLVVFAMMAHELNSVFSKGCGGLRAEDTPGKRHHP
jgi:hypothetical protein